MAERKPLVLISGQVQELPAGDTLPGVGGGSSAGSFGIILDGQGSAVSTGLKGFLTIPFSGTITGWDLLANISGSIVIDIWKDTYANFPPTVDDTIFGTKPALSSQQKNQATGLSIAVTAGDIVAFNVDSASTVSWVALIMKINKS